MIRWTEAGEEREALWRSALGAPPPGRVVTADDRVKADTAYRLACEGTALLWRGDFQNARQLLSAMGRRCKPAAPGSGFQGHRQAQSQRARTLGMLLIPYDADHVVPLRRAPDVREACAEVYGPCAPPAVGQLRELLGVIGAHEWRKKGVYVPALGARVHPHHGVFSPIRGEYVDLVAEAPLPGDRLAFDVGTGTGVLAAVLARRGVRHVVATDLDQRAVDCAGDNVSRLGLEDRVEIVRTDLFPPGRAQLVVCNPPWLPAKPVSPLDQSVYDPGGQMLRGFLNGLTEHLEPAGEGWLILSDLAERLGLRTRAELMDAFGQAGLSVAGRMDVAPRHPKATDEQDPLHAARAAEVTSLWRLRPSTGTPS
ncbi:class I SAM-dependent methyltransferase [Nonomuraea sp. K274]|uniref:Class I SAM-dependent methyltransferase n=1 Tax=Nonomuraea cypriaca TaxID=1187855 RepID=A0A931F6E6_9ACTN|nr:class I SAM-dependent methyltransferase [Nonomuraea cypriaca]MBF8193071.1 class I SAM-dependent methyltransferase [Nonomuraea cypriaca]